MKKRSAPIFCILLAVLLIAGSVAVVSFSAQDRPAANPVGMGETLNRSNINGNSYNRYTSVVRSYLCATDDGYMRVYGSDNGRLLAEYYDRSYRFVTNRYVDAGLPMFGGFCAHGGYYFVVTGDENPNEDDSREVLRIARFDKDWQPCGYEPFFGFNTVMPFSAGRVAFAFYGDMMVIRTTHRIYLTQGYNHQTNLTIVFDPIRMTVKDYFCDIATTRTAGYLSHSFNQFIAVDDDGTVVCLDHGDAHPRSAVLGRFTGKGEDFVIYNGGKKTYQFTPIIEYTGEPGDNFTASMLGGVACSSSAYLTVGSHAAQDENYRTNSAFNAYITVTDKNVADLADAETRFIYLSSYKEGDGRYASNPQLVRIDSDRFLVMWNELPVGKGSFPIEERTEYDESCVMKYVFINGRGELTTPIMTAPVNEGIFVSECEPIVDGSRVLWYVTDGSRIASIIEMDLSGRITVHADIIPDSLVVYPINLSRTSVSFRIFDRIPADTVITEDNIDDYVVVTDNGRPLTRGKDYNLAPSDAIRVDTDQTYVTRITLKLTTVPNYSYLPLSYTYNWSVSNGSLFLNSAIRGDDGVHLTTVARRGVGYHIYRKEAGSDSEYELIGTVTNKLIGTYVDTTASRAKVYTYIIREYTFDREGSEVLSEPSGGRSVAAVPGYIPTEEPTDLPTLPPTEPPAQPTTQPTVQPTAPPATEPPAASVLLGDADMDGKVTILDATCIQRWLAKLNSDQMIDRAAADADTDGKVTILDATAIQRWLVKIPTGYPIGQPYTPAH